MIKFEILADTVWIKAMKDDKMFEITIPKKEYEEVFKKFEWLNEKLNESIL